MSRIYFWLPRALARGVRTGAGPHIIHPRAKARGNQKYDIKVLCASGVLNL